MVGSGRADSNRRPPAPKAGALTKLRYAPLKHPLSRENAESGETNYLPHRLLNT